MEHSLSIFGIVSKKQYLYLTYTLSDWLMPSLSQMVKVKCGISGSSQISLLFH